MTEDQETTPLNRTANVPEGVTAPADRALLRQWLEYQRGRRTVGEITLRNRTLRREARLVELEDGERILLLVLEDALCYWAPSTESIDCLHRRACDWLTEPAPPSP
jgi:hypothetical protein